MNIDRLHLVRLATQDDNRIKCSDIEFNLPKPSYTTNTLDLFAEKYPEHKFSIIWEAIVFKILHKWKNYETIINNYPIYVYQERDLKLIKTFDKATYNSECSSNSNLGITNTRIYKNRQSRSDTWFRKK